MMKAVKYDETEKENTRELIKSTTQRRKKKEQQGRGTRGVLGFGAHVGDWGLGHVGDWGWGTRACLARVHLGE